MDIFWIGKLPLFFQSDRDEDELYFEAHFLRVMKLLVTKQSSNYKTTVRNVELTK